MRRILTVNIMILLIFASASYWMEEGEKLKDTMASAETIQAEVSEPEVEKKYIKGVDFQVSCLALSESYEYDRDTYGTDHHIRWTDLLAWTAAHTGGSFSDDRKVCSLLTKLEKAVEGGKTLEQLTESLDYFSYYQEAYEAVLGGMVGEYEMEETEEGDQGRKVMKKRYGLKAFHPIAKGFPYTDYDDFGVSRTYGYRRAHLGHDMMGQTGTPVVCVESGYVEVLGWNQYGGWRIGIRSFDRKRYYYYAHLRQGFPYQPELKEGSVVLAGDVIGYMGHTGYSVKENVNNIDQTHLHFGMQLIFDESQKDGDDQIWIDCYQIVRFLYRQQSETIRDDETKEWRRVYLMKDPAAETYERTLDFSMYP